MVAYRQIYRRIILKEENKRPNENYNLSYPDGKKNENNESMTFYYNRERRLASAPKGVQDIYKENKPSRFALFSVLVADKPRMALFLTIVILCAVIIILSRIGIFDTSSVLSGNKIEISGTLFEETTIILIKKITRNAEAYTGAVDVAVSVPHQPGEEQNHIFTHRIYFSLENEEIYRFAVPFNSEELLIVLQSDKSEIQLKFKPQ